MHILFVTSTRIGDAVLSTGLLHHLISVHPDARVTIACGPVAAPLFEAVPGLERVIALAKRPWAGHWRALRREVKGRRWDVVVDLRNSLATLLLGAGKRYAAGRERKGIPRVVQLARVLNLPEPPSPRLWTAARHEAEADSLMPSAGASGYPLLAIGPTANWAGKEWPVDRFVALARALTAPDGPLPDARLLLTGAPHETDAARPLFDAFPAERIFNLFVPAPLLTVYACLRRADFFVGNDSGLMHMAAAAGCPTLGLFGPTDDSLYAPWGDHCAVVRTPESYKELFTPGLDVRNTGTLMGGLSVEAAERAARDLIARTREG